MNDRVEGAAQTFIENLAVAKSKYAADVAKINNNMGHMKDMTTGLDNFANNQNSRIDDLIDTAQSQFDIIDGKISGINNDLTDNKNQDTQTRNNLSAAKDSPDAVKTKADSIDTKVTGLDLP